MRKVLFSILLATTVATPALAQSSDRADRAAARQERQAQRDQAREERSQAREERVQVREERVQPRDNGNFQPQQQNVQIQQEVARQRDRNVNERGRPTLGNQQAPDSVSNWRREQRDAQQQQRTDRRDVMQQQVEQRDALRQQRRAQVSQQQQDWRDRWVDAARSGRRLPPPAGARPNVPAPPPSTAYNDYGRTPTWDRNWRNNNHYDWRNYRHHHRSIFHLGFYLDPFGWGYQRYGIGWRLWPSYYSSNYWLDNPGYYALPYAPWPYKWVRYYDDALLVNVYTGQVVDVMYDFFW